MPHRLAIVLSHPTQYYSPWFAHITATGQVQLRVFYLWDFGVAARRDQRFQQSFKWDIDLLDGYEHEFVPNCSKDPGTHHREGLNNPELLPRLRLFAPDSILLFGYNYQSHLHLIRRAGREGWRLLFRGDSHLLGHPQPSWLKRSILRRVFRRFDACLYVGRANRDYFRTFGVDENRLIFAPHAVDAARFSQPLPPANVAAQRRELGVDEDTQIILFAGKLHPEKAPASLLEAYGRLPTGNHLLVISGSGEEQERLQAQADQTGPNRVRFLPFANQSEMPLRYALSDLFVLPSEGLYETWGLAVNEAMHGGVPCIVSDRVGCQQDLITHGETGWVFHAGDIDALQNCLESGLACMAKATSREQLQQAVRARISHYTYRQTTAGLWQALGIDAEKATV